MNILSCLIDFETKKVNLDLYNKDYSYKEKEIDIRVIGLFCGVYYQGKQYSPSESVILLVELIRENDLKLINSFMSSIVGPSYLMTRHENSIDIWSSPSSNGFFYSSLDISNLIIISNDEKRFYKEFKKNNLSSKVSNEYIFNAIYSHHSLMRSPFDGLYIDSFRCPPGFSLNINDGLSLEPFMLRDSSELETNRMTQATRVKKLEEAYINTVDMYSKYLPEFKYKTKLNFSGGIDSTLLLLLFKDKVANLQLSYKDYSNNYEIQLAKEIAKYMRLNLDIKIEKKRPDSFEILKKRLSVGIDGILGLTYLGHTLSLNEKHTDTSYILSGQNADTLIHIDTYAPPNWLTGFSRFLFLCKGMLKRYKYSIPFYKNNILNFLISNSSSNSKSIHSLVINSLYTQNEHYDQNSSIESKEGEYNKTIREKYFVDRIKTIIEKKYPYIKWNSTQSYEYPYTFNHAIRFIRWIRTISNFSQSFKNKSLSEDVDYLTPYSEGPIASVLLDWEIGIFDSFSIKRNSYALIKKLAGHSYSYFRRKSVGGLIKEDVKRVFRILNRKFKNNHIKSYKLDSSVKNILLKEKSSLVKLATIYNSKQGAKELFWLNNVNDKFISSYITKLSCQLLHPEKISYLTKEEGMKLCRMVSIAIFILEIQDQ